MNLVDSQEMFVFYSLDYALMSLAFNHSIIQSRLTMHVEAVISAMARSRANNFSSII